MSAATPRRRTSGPLRVGVLGQGRSGYGIHCRWFEQSPRKYRIAAVADLLADRRREAESRFGCDSYREHRDLLARDDLDLVVNALPSHLHPPVTIEALGGRPPRGLREARRLERGPARPHDRRRRQGPPRLAPFQQSRYRALFRKTLEVIDSGVLGRILQVRITANGFARRWDWQTLQEFKGGNLLNTGPHFLDWAVCLQGFRKPDRVFCVMDTANTSGDAEDYVKVVLRKKGAPVIDLEISSCDAYPSGETIHAQGTRGGLSGGNDGLRWRYYDERRRRGSG